MKKSVATASFSRDFSKYRKTEIELIDSVVHEFIDMQGSRAIIDFFAQQISDLRSDLGSIDILESEKAGESIDEQHASMNLCNQWVTNNIVPAPFATHIALALWMNGRDEGVRILRKVTATAK